MKLQDIQKMLSERKLTKAESKKKEEIAQAMEKEHPGMGSTPEGMSKKMAIATAQAKKCCEEIEGELETEETLDEVSNYDLVVNYYRHLGLDPYKLRGAVGKQLRTKIKASPAFQAWARINSSFEYEKKYTQIIEKIKGKQGIHGLHIMPVGWEDIVPRIVTEAGLLPKGFVQPVSTAKPLTA